MREVYVEKRNDDDARTRDESTNRACNDNVLSRALKRDQVKAGRPAANYIRCGGVIMFSAQQRRELPVIA